VFDIFMQITYEQNGIKMLTWYY